MQFRPLNNSITAAASAWRTPQWFLSFIINTDLSPVLLLWWLALIVPSVIKTILILYYCRRANYYYRMPHRNFLIIMILYVTQWKFTGMYNEYSESILLVAFYPYFLVIFMVIIISFQMYKNLWWKNFSSFFCSQLAFYALFLFCEKVLIIKVTINVFSCMLWHKYIALYLYYTICNTIVYYRFITMILLVIINMFILLWIWKYMLRVNNYIEFFY